MSEQNQNFRAGVKDWIKDNFPSTLKGQNPATVGYAAALEDDHDLWRQRLAEKGWGAPTWSIGSMTKLMPFLFFASGSVLTTAPHHWD